MTVQAGAALEALLAAIRISLPTRRSGGSSWAAFAAALQIRIGAWLVPVAATIAAPALWWNVLVILVASGATARGPRADEAADRPLARPPSAAHRRCR